MPNPDPIRDAILTVKRSLAERPELGVGTDAFARASLDAGLLTRVEGPAGQQAATDMSPTVGGGASAPSPGWYVRAGIASCTATIIAMRAAELGIPLRHLAVTVESRSDDRGMIGVDDRVPAGPLAATLRVEISADGVPTETLHEISRWGIAHSPMTDALTRAVPLTTEVEFVAAG